MRFELMQLGRMRFELFRPALRRTRPGSGPSSRTHQNPQPAAPPRRAAMAPLLLLGLIAWIPTSTPGLAQTSVGFNIDQVEVAESLFTASLWVGRFGDLSVTTTVEITLEGSDSATLQEDFLFEGLFNPNADLVEADRLVLTLGPSVSQTLTSVTILPDSSSDRDRVFRARLRILSGAQSHEGKFSTMTVRLLDANLPGADLATEISAPAYEETAQGEAEIFVRNISADGTSFGNIMLEVSTTAPVTPCATGPSSAPDLAEFFQPTDPIDWATDRSATVAVGTLTSGQTAGFRLCYFRADGSLPVGERDRPPEGAYSFEARVTSSAAVPDSRPDNDRDRAVAYSVNFGCLGDPYSADCCAAQVIALIGGGFGSRTPPPTEDTILYGSRGATARRAKPTWWSRLTAAPAHFFDTARDLALLYRFRDAVLTRTPGGRRATELYYEHSHALRDLVLLDSTVRHASLDLLDLVAPHLRALVDGRGDEVVVTSTVVDALRDYFTLLEGRASHSFRAALVDQRQRLDFDAAIGATATEALELLDTLSCGGSRSSLCLADRFRVEVLWTDFGGHSGSGSPRSLTDDTGAFWFFDDENLELMVKTLDASGINGHWWVFFGALSNVEYRVVVTDTLTGRPREYSNALGVFGSGGDTEAFPSSNPGRSLTNGEASDFLRFASAEPLQLSAADQRLQGSGTAMGTCTVDRTTLCLGEGRFALQVEWTDFAGNIGEGRPVPLTVDSGAFWFFDEQNLELMVKVLDGTAINGHWWLFYGSLSNVAYTLHVHDTVTGEATSYENLRGTFASSGDTEALLADRD